MIRILLIMFSQVNPIKIETKSEREYNSFKMYIPKSKLPLFSEDSFWPENVFIRRFFIFKDRVNKDEKLESACETNNVIGKTLSPK